MKIQFSTLDGDTSNAQLAATAIALDVPLDSANPWTIATGDGINGTRAVWHFKGASKDGNTIGSIMQAWHSRKWQAEHPDHEVTRIRTAFNVMQDMADTAKGKAAYYTLIYPRDTVSTASTPMAATMEAIGHRCIGYTSHNQTLFWHFDRAAAADMALWEKHNIHELLPDSLVAYIKCALLNWKTLLVECATPQMTAVKYKNRTAYVGKDADMKTQLSLEKLLFRK